MSQTPAVLPIELMSTYLLVVVATLAWGVWAFALRQAVSHIPPLAAHIVYGSATLALVPFYVALARRWDVPLTLRGAGPLWAALAAVLVGIGLVAMLYAMRGAEASPVVALTATYPVVTMLLAIAFLGESMSLSRACGVLAIAAGAFLVSR